MKTATKLNAMAGAGAGMFVMINGERGREMRIELPCNIGETVYVDVRTLPYNYLHPFDKCKHYAKCKVIGFQITKSGVYMKMSALYPSRMHRREYLRYGIGAIGKTVFFNLPEDKA